MADESASVSTGDQAPSDRSSDKRPFYKSPFFWGFLIGIALLTAMRPIAMSFRSAPPPMLEIGAWSLTSQEGEPFGTRELEGKVWIASFFFTSCPSVCPELTRKMKELEERVRGNDDIRLVSFSVDPDTDTPEKLRAYREKFGIDTDQWVFLTGTRQQMLDVVLGQMKLHVGDKELIPGLSAEESAQRQLYDISHSAQFALFDQNADLRALSSTDAHGLARILDGAKLLVEKGPDA